MYPEWICASSPFSHNSLKVEYSINSGVKIPTAVGVCQLNSKLFRVYCQKGKQCHVKMLKFQVLGASNKLPNDRITIKKSQGQTEHSSPKCKTIILIVAHSGQSSASSATDESSEDREALHQTQVLRCLATFAFRAFSVRRNMQLQRHSVITSYP